MELPTEHIIIIFWAMALNSVCNFRRYLIDSREKFQKSLHIFLNPSEIVRQNTRALVLTRPSVNSDRRALRFVHHLSVNASIYTSIIMACPLVYPSVIVAKCRNFFATLCEIPTSMCPSVYPSVKLAIFLFIVCLSSCTKT